MLMIGKTLTAEQRVTKALADILGNTNYIALAGILMMSGHKVVENGENGCITASTNGINVWYARGFVEGLKDAELRFLILHETYHMMYKHLTTYSHLYEQNGSKANRACDYVINLKLVDFDNDTAKGFITLPKGGLIDERYRGMDSEQVYKLLPDEGGGGTGTGETLDHHDWEGAKEMPVEVRKELERAVDEAIQQGALVAGTMGLANSRLLEDVLQSVVDWREALREFVSTTCTGSDYSTWRRPNRRYISAGLYLPSGISEVVGEIVVAIDTSGSIAGRDIAQFLGEVSAITKAVRPTGVHLLYWDTTVCREEYYAQAQLDAIINTTRPTGGGGTEVGCVPAYLQEKQITPQAVIVLTDGYLGGWGEWSVPVMWAVLNNASAKPSIGKCVHINTSRM